MVDRAINNIAAKAIKAAESQKNYILTIVINYCEEDRHFMKEAIKSCPAWAQIITIYNYEIDDNLTPDWHPELIDNSGNISNYKMGHREMEFDKMRNAGTTLAETPLILQLDADERLVVNQWDALKFTCKKIIELNKPGAVMSMICTNVMTGERINIAAARLYRPGNEWRYPIHEILDITDFIDSDLMIYHTGYNHKDKKETSTKRNFEILWKHPELMNDKRIRSYMIKTAMSVYEIENNVTLKAEKNE